MLFNIFLDKTTKGIKKLIKFIPRNRSTNLTIILCKINTGIMRKFLMILKRVLLGLIIFILLFVGYFLGVRTLDQRAMEMKGFYQPEYDTSKATRLPSMFINGERFYIKMPTLSGDTLLAFGDSGGGISILLSQAVEKKHLQSKLKIGIFQGIMPVKYILFKDLVNNSNIPPPFPLRIYNIRRPFSRVAKPFLLVPPNEGEIKEFTKFMPRIDIFLGQNFFMGKSWTFDYIHQQVWVNTPISTKDGGKPGVQRLGFKKNGNHEPIFGHPSMVIEINGEVIDVLFDTGASILLSDSGKKQMNTHSLTIGGSFIAASIFDKWRKEHPEWKYYKDADKKRDVIEVPIVKIGNIEVGPVLFSKRPDEDWSKGMISTMDKIVKGAIGGSAFKYLKVTIDYNSELIKFEQ